VSAGDARRRLELALADHGCSVRGNSAQCPAHEDRTPSLSIGDRKDGRGVLVSCKAGNGCATDAVLEALDMSAGDLFDEPRERGSGSEWTPHGEAVAVYDYTDEAGALLFQVCRTADKQFPQRHPDPSAKSGWAWNMKGVTRVPYRLPRVRKAAKGPVAGRTVYIVEGEKDVHALELAGVTATCNPGGAGKWQPAYGRHLVGIRRAVIVADKDAPGREHALKVRELIARYVGTLTIVEAAEGKDAADHLAAGYGIEDFRPVSSSDADAPDAPDSDTADTQDTQDGGLAALAVKYVPVDWEAAWKGQPDAVEWLIEPVLEAGTVNSLFALPGTGKSLLALEWALRLVRSGRTVVYLDDENRLSDIVERLQAFGAEPAELGRLLLYSFAGLPPLDTLAGGVDLLALAVGADAALVVLDTTSRMVAGKENDSDTFLALYRFAMRPLKSRGITVLRLDHPGKDAERGQRGSSAKDGDVDTIWLLKETLRGKKYLLERRKSRSGHGAGEILEVERRYAPVCHVWTVPDSATKMTALGQLCGQLSALKVPPSAGRDRCRTALTEAGIPARNDLLSEVIKHRKYGCDCPGQPGTGGTAQSPGRQLSPVPPLSIERDRGQVSGDQSADSGELWPEGSHGEAAS
jgi:hypothetical protein